MWLTWQMWGLSAVLLFGGELWTRNYVLLWPALAAAATSAAALAGLSEERQLTLFSVCAIVLLALSRTLLQRWLSPRPPPRRRFVGRTGRVLERVGAGQNGTVQLRRRTYAATSAADVVLEPGASARILSFDDGLLVVEPAAATAPPSPGVPVRADAGEALGKHR